MEAPSRDPIRVLLAEPQDAAFARLAQALAELRDPAVEVSRAADLQAAELQLEPGSDYDIYLFAHDWPDGSGLSLLSRAEQLCVRAPCVLLLDEDDDALGQRALLAGAVDYLVKDLLTAPLLGQSLRRARVRAAATARLRADGIQDYLTRVHSRPFLSRLLEAELERSYRYGYPVSVMMVDVDNFIPINQAFGQRQGDQILRAVVEVCDSCLRSTDFMGRWGDDEFLVVAPHNRATEVVRIANRMRKAVTADVADRFELSLEPLTITIGIAEYPADARSMDRLIAMADSALLHAKSLGRDRVHVYCGSEPLVVREFDSHAVGWGLETVPDAADERPV